MVLTTGTASASGDWDGLDVDPVDGLALRPNGARVHNCLLGGKDYYRQDEQAAAAIRRVSPRFMASVQAGRRFMTRVARYLAAERGLAQFLDIGAGLPLWPDLHDVVHQARPDARVVYVDNDPLVTCHVRALSGASAGGVTECLQGDLRRPERILATPQAARALDAGEPVAVTLLSVLQALPDDDEIRRAISALLDPFPRGSALAICTICSDGLADEARAVERVCQKYAVPVRHRSWAQIRALFPGLVLEQPGVVPVQRWHPGPADRAQWDRRMMMVGGVATKR
jgi:hypothetical protein